MPFLRSLEAVASSTELRSSKTLIGSAAATCDVVVTGDNVLDLHALLNLAADKASAKLVPFSTTDAGVCYVNGVVVPREGAVVVHGDKVAFGYPRNVFLFELTPHPQMTAMTTSTPQQSIETEHSIDPSNASNNRAFRKALDTLRGDRKTTTPTASVMASIQSNLPGRNRSSISSASSSAPSPSKSKDQLSKFLLEASTDSLLSDYVERKLKQRQTYGNLGKNAT
ncbi:SMAD/FHA domain [Phytophthora cinnamomi]|uniref:SMAD/FHA domain n=1 Tax=Phytophthora cinnamomi TaxID=4785 RepID=UPI00355A3A4B|nr:SMAD/FHA domain [Phytophthora cinnamomi]